MGIKQMVNCFIMKRILMRQKRIMGPRHTILNMRSKILLVVAIWLIKKRFSLLEMVNLLKLPSKMQKFQKMDFILPSVSNQYLILFKQISGSKSSCLTLKDFDNVKAYQTSLISVRLPLIAQSFTIWLSHIQSIMLMLKHSKHMKMKTNLLILNQLKLMKIKLI